MLIEHLEQARLGDGAALHTLTVSEGRVQQIREHLPASLPAPRTLQANGRLLVPAFVDAHVHLDKAFLLAFTGNTEPTLPAAIASVAALRGVLSLRQVRENAERAVDLLLSQGVIAARVHVEIDPAVGLELWHFQRELAERVADRIELQLVAFPQRGLELPGMVELMTAAVAEGAPVIGGCPYVDADPARHLDLVFALAERYARPIDLHLDFSDDPGRSLLALVAERTRAHGMQARVTIGHVTTLAAMAPAAQAAALDELAAAGIGLTVLPATDLYLAGHGEPGTRSLAPIARARAHGVRVAIANNNLQNPFAPFGNGNLIQAAWLAGIVGRASDATCRKQLLEAITSEPAKLLGLPEHGPVVGALAHLALLDTDRESNVPLLAPSVLATLRDGRLVHRLSSPDVVP